MANITLKGNPIHTCGELPAIGNQGKDFLMIKKDLSETSLYSLQAKFKVLNIFPSIDTGICAMSVRTFNKHAASIPDTLVLNISKDLPFAQGRFCGAEGIDKADVASVFNSDFARQYGLEIIDGPLKGLCSRVVIILDRNNKVIYSEQVPEIAQEPNYENALQALR